MQSELEIVPLTGEDISKLPRPRAGFLAFVESLFTLYEENRSQLGTSGPNVRALRKDVVAYQALVRREKELHDELRKVQRTRIFRAATIWRGMLDIYRRARCMTPINGALGKVVERFTRFLRKPKKKRPGVSPPTSR